MSTLSAIILGVLIGWLVEWVIDWLYWRKKRVAVKTMPATVSESAGAVSLQEKTSTLLLQDKTSENDALHHEIAGLKNQLEKYTNIPDDLKIIKGIGPEIERRLHAAGVKSFVQLAELTPLDLENILGSMIKRLVDEGDILDQARRLAQKK